MTYDKVRLFFDINESVFHTQSSFHLILPFVDVDRVTESMYQVLQNYAYPNGSIKYYVTINDQAGIAMPPNGYSDPPMINSGKRRCVVVVTAGTTDNPVAEEAVVTYVASQCSRPGMIFDAGVAGLHRIVKMR